MSKLLQRILAVVAAMLFGMGTAAATESRTLFQFGGLDYSEADLSAEHREKVFSASWQPLELVRFDRGSWLETVIAIRPGRIQRRGQRI